MFSLLILTPTAQSAFTPTPYFKEPSSTVNGWHPICFSKDLKSKPLNYKFHEEEWVVWRGKQGLYARPNICPHLGSRLQRSEIVGESLICPYHSVRIGVDSPDCQAAVCGAVIELDGLVWWNGEENPNDALPNCEDMLPDDLIATVRMEKHLNAAFADAWMNGMDWHHAGSVHKNTFGNAVKEPSRIVERWLNKDRFRVDFFYTSNEKYSRFTGGRTKNYHEFILPSTTYNRVSNADNGLLIHVAMRSTGVGSTIWLVTAQSSFVPNNALGCFLLSRAVEYIVNNEDGIQLQDMGNMDMRRAQYAGEVKLPLDGVYQKVFDGPAPEWEKRILGYADIDNANMIEKYSLLLGTLNESSTSIDILNTWLGTWHLMWTPWSQKNGPTVIETTALEERFKIKQECFPIKSAGLRPVKGMENLDHVTNITGNLVKTTSHEFHVVYASNEVLIRNASKGLQILKRRRFVDV